MWVTARRRAAVGRAGCLAKCTLRAKDAGCRGCRMQLSGPCRNIGSLQEYCRNQTRLGCRKENEYCVRPQILCKFGCRTKCSADSVQIRLQKHIVHDVIQGPRIVER